MSSFKDAPANLIPADPAFYPLPVQKLQTAAKQRGHVLPRSPILDLNQPGRLRTAHILAICGYSHMTLYNRMKSGVFPKPDGKDGGLNYWNTRTIKNFLEGYAGGEK